MSHVLSTAVILGVVLHLVSCATGPFSSYVVEAVGPEEVAPGFGRATGINDAGYVISYTVRARTQRVGAWVFFDRHPLAEILYRSWEPLSIYEEISPGFFETRNTYVEGINDDDFSIYQFTATGGFDRFGPAPEPDSDEARRSYHAVNTDGPLASHYELEALRGGRFSGGRDINDAWWVTGWSEILVDEVDNRREVHAFLRTPGSRGGPPRMLDLGTLGGAYSQGEAINARGQIAGFSEAAIGSSFPHRAFRYTPGVGMINLGTLSGGNLSRAYGINDQGHVVGESATSSVLAPRSLSSIDLDPPQPFTASYAFLWTEGTGMRRLGSLGGDSVATAINNHNVVVGYSELTEGRASPHSGHAFRWTAERGMIDLNNLLPEGSGWELLNAYDINDRGQIVGSGRFEGQIRAYRLSRVRIGGQPT